MSAVEHIVQDRLNKLDGTISYQKGRVAGLKEELYHEEKVLSNMEKEQKELREWLSSRGFNPKAVIRDAVYDAEADACV